MRAIDQWVLGRATKVAYAWQRLTGLTSFWIARQGAVAAILGDGLDTLSYWLPINKIPPSAVSVGFHVVTMAIFTLVFRKLDRVDNELGKNAALPAELRELREWTPAVSIRMFYLVVLAISILVTPYSWFVGHVNGVDLATIFGVCGGVLVCFYFLHVDPLPPGTSKVRQWLNSFTAAPVLTPVRETT